MVFQRVLCPVFRWRSPGADPWRRLVYGSGYGAYVTMVIALTLASLRIYVCFENGLRGFGLL